MAKHRDIEGEAYGEYGKAIVDDVDVLIGHWQVGPADLAAVQGFLQLQQVNYTRYNVTLTFDLKGLTEQAFQTLSRPVSRTVVDYKITLQPEIVLRKVKLYAEKADPLPDVEFDEIRIIAGPAASPKLLHLVCVNLTAPKWSD